MGLRRNGIALEVVRKMTGIEPNNRIDEDSLYGIFNESVKQNQKLNNKAAHKALNLPMDDDMQINTTTNNYGSKGGSLGTIAKLAIGAGLITTGAGLPYGLGLIADALKNKPAPTTPATDSDTLFNLELVK